LYEADVLESGLMGFVEFKVTRDMMRRAGVRGLKKVVRTPAIVDWGQDVSSGLKAWGLANKKSGDGTKSGPSGAKAFVPLSPT
jgi:hypothetical protein